MLIGKFNVYHSYTHGTTAFGNQIQTGINIENYLADTNDEIYDGLKDHRIKEYILELKNRNTHRQITIVKQKLDEVTDLNIKKFFADHDKNFNQILEFYDKIYVDNISQLNF